MRTLGLVLTALVIGGSVTPSSAQECPDSTGEGFRWKDPITRACHKAALNTKPKIRRGGTVRLTVVRNLIDFTDRTALAQQNIGVTFVAAGNTKGIGFITVDLALANAGLEDKIIRFPHLTGGFNPTIAIVRRGEVTGITQVPTEPRWGTSVAVTVKGRDIGNAGLLVEHHTLSGISNTDTELKFTAKGAGTTYHGWGLIEAWDKGYTRGAVRYAKYVPGWLTPTIFNYASYVDRAPCVTVPNIGAPVLSAPTTGSLATNFYSPTNPINARTTFTWQLNGDPERKYILHLEAYPLTTFSTTTTTTRSGSIALAPLNTVEKTVGPFAVDDTEGRSVEYLARHRTYKWKVRAVNCGLSTPWSAVFTHNIN